jgi:trigger factor
VVSAEEVEAELQRVADMYQMELEQVKAAVSEDAVKADLGAQKAVKLIVDNAVAVDVAAKEEA